MNGILLAEQGNNYQIIGEVSSVEEAREMAQEYLKHDPQHDCLAPEQFVIVSRGDWGYYTNRKVLEL